MSTGVREEIDNNRQSFRQIVNNNKIFDNFSTSGCNGTFVDEEANVILGWDPPQKPYQEDDSTKLLCHFNNIYEGEDDEVAMGIDKSCIAYYKFDEGIGTTAYDSSGNENHGTINGATWVDGKYDNGLYLGGVVTSYIITNPIKNFAATDITAMFWLKTTDVTNTGTPISYASSASDNEFLINNYKSLNIYKGSGSQSTGISANDGFWHHITVTWENSTGRLILYKDGTSVYSNTLSVGQGLTPGGSLVIGQDQDNVGGGFQGSQAFLGSIDEVAILNRNLSADEIANIYMHQFMKLQNTPDQTSFENGKFSKGVRIEKDDTLAYPIGSDTDPSCVGFWKFNEGTGNTARDSSKYENHGSWYGYTNANWTEGVYGTALHFDGVDDYVDCGNDASLNNLGDFSIEGWINLPNPTDGYYKPIISKHTSDGTINNNAEFNFQVQNDGNLNFLMGNGASAPRLDGGVLTANTWYHVAVTMEGTYRAMYLNGELVDSDFFSGTRQYGNLPVQISRYDNQDTGWQKFNGMIDEVVIYSRAKSVEEIYTDYISRGQNNFNINEGTLELYVKPDWNGNDGEKHTLFFSGDRWNNDSFFIYKDSDNYLKFVTADNSSNLQAYPKVDIRDWTKDNWYNLAFTWAATGTKTIYINGYKTATASNNYMPVLSHSSLDIGSTHQNFRSFEGVIDELRISDKVRADHELREYYSMGIYESEVTDAGEVVAWENISWNALNPQNTHLYLQSRTSKNNITWTQWTGNSNPSETESKGYLTSTGELLNALPARYLQWRVVLKSTDGSNSPTLQNVTITWNHLPKAINVTITPVKPTILDDLVIDYDYSDIDGNPEEMTTFEWLVDRGTGVFLSSGFDTQNLASSWTAFNERWFCKITPHDGKDYGFPVESPIVKIAQGNITEIGITPAYIEISADDTVQFSAKALDSDNNEIPTIFTWNISGGGTIDQNGLFSPRITGLHFIYASAEGVFGAAMVTVAPGELHHILISPNNPKITTDDVIEFEAVFMDAENNTVPDLNATWNISGGGIIDPSNGTFEATTPGEFTVTARANNTTGHTNMNIKSGAPERSNLTPQNPTITADDQLHFDVEAYDKDKNEITTDFEWYAENGNISSLGLFTPEKIGTWKISVIFNVFGIEANTTVTVLHGKLTELQLDPDEHEMSIDEKIKFRTIGSDSKNNQWTDVDVVWSLDNSTLGEISQDGNFRAKKSGSVTVSAAVTLNTTSRANGKIIGRAYVIISTDGDNDGMLDEWEQEYGLNFKDAKDANWDSDGDGLTNIEEHQYDTDPRNSDTDNDGYSDKEEIDEGTDPKDKSDYPTKESEENLIQMISIIIIILLFIVIVGLLLARRKRKKPKEEEEEAVEEEWEMEEEEGEEKEEEEEKESEEEIELEELKEEPLVEEEPISEDEELIDIDVGEKVPFTKAVKIKGKLPKKGKMPGKPSKIIEPNRIDIEHEIAPELVKLEDKSVTCGICLGAIKTGLMAIKCRCGKYYHESCGVRVGECPRCDRKFKIEKLAKLKKEEVKELEELEESELAPNDFKKKKEEGKKVEREEYAKILKGLEKRLANGEISETTYLMLRKKYEK